MKKIKINLDIVLPDIPDEHDACVKRIMNELRGKQGIEKIHIVPALKAANAPLCFHYDPDIITVEHVQNLAGQAGAW